MSSKEAQTPCTMTTATATATATQNSCSSPPRHHLQDTTTPNKASHHPSEDKPTSLSNATLPSLQPTEQQAKSSSTTPKKKQYRCARKRKRGLQRKESKKKSSSSREEDSGDLKEENKANCCGERGNEAAHGNMYVKVDLSLRNLTNYQRGWRGRESLFWSLRTWEQSLEKSKISEARRKKTLTAWEQRC